MIAEYWVFRIVSIRSIAVYYDGMSCVPRYSHTYNYKVAVVYRSFQSRFVKSKIRVGGEK